jgi:hypothetical protein
MAADRAKGVIYCIHGEWTDPWLGRNPRDLTIYLFWATQAWSWEAWRWRRKDITLIWGAHAWWWGVCVCGKGAHENTVLLHCVFYTVCLLSTLGSSLWGQLRGSLWKTLQGFLWMTAYKLGTLVRNSQWVSAHSAQPVVCAMLTVSWGLPGILAVCFPPSKDFVSWALGLPYFWFASAHQP